MTIEVHWLTLVAIAVFILSIPMAFYYIRRAARKPLPHSPGLTPRQSQVARLISMGKTNAEVARELGITEGTVKNYVHDCCVRLNIPHDRLNLALWYLSHNK